MPTVLKVMTYNIAHGQGIDGILDLRRIAGIIRETDPDIVGLQEVDRHFSERTQFADQVRQLADELQMHAAFGPNIDDDPPEPGGKRRQYGTLTLSKHSILESRNHELPQIISPDTWNERRGLLEALIDVQGIKLRFFNTHLGLRQAERKRQVESVLELTGGRGETAVLVGDFNATPAKPEIGRFAAWTDALAVHGLREEATLLQMKGKRGTPGAVIERSSSIDYIFCTKGIVVRDAGIRYGTESDHLALTAVLEL